MTQHTIKTNLGPLPLPRGVCCWTAAGITQNRCNLQFKPLNPNSQRKPPSSACDGRHSLPCVRWERQQLPWWCWRARSPARCILHGPASTGVCHQRGKGGHGAGVHEPKRAQPGHLAWPADAGYQPQGRTTRGRRRLLHWQQRCTRWAWSCAGRPGTRGWGRGRARYDAAAGSCAHFLLSSLQAMNRWGGLGVARFPAGRLAARHCIMLFAPWVPASFAFGGTHPTCPGCA